MSTEIQFNSWPRIAPGIYPAYSRRADVYFDRRFKRWVCLVRFDVLDQNQKTIATLAWFLNLGRDQKKPRAGTMSKFYSEWVKANGGKPKRQDRMTPEVFIKRMATVFVSDTTKNHRQESVAEDSCYSQITQIQEWNTASTNQLINQSTKPAVKGLPEQRLTENPWQQNGVSITTDARVQFLERQKQEILAKFNSLPEAGQGQLN